MSTHTDYDEVPDVDPRPTTFETAERDSAGRAVCRYRPVPAAHGPDDEQWERWAGDWDL